MHFQFTIAKKYDGQDFKCSYLVGTSCQTPGAVSSSEDEGDEFDTDEKHDSDEDTGSKRSKKHRRGGI